MPGQLRQNTAVTITIGQFINWSDSKTPLYLALGSNTNFDPTLLTCTLTKGSSQSVLTLTKTGGNNNINLLADSQVSFELTAGNVDTCGRLVLSFNNATAGSEVILEGKTFEFEVLSANAYDFLYGTSNPQVDIVKLGGVAQSLTDLKDFADSGYDPTTHKIETCKINDDMRGTDDSLLAENYIAPATPTNITDSQTVITNAITGIPAAVWEVSVRSLSTFGTLVSDIATAVWGFTTKILTAGTNIVLAKGTGITGLNDIAASDVRTQADAALTAYGANKIAPATPQNIVDAIDALNDLSPTELTSALSAIATSSEVQGILTAVGALNNLSESQVSTLLSGLATSVEITSVLEAISAIEGGATAEEVVDALMASSNFTEGGVMEFATLLKNLAAGIEGTWNIKAGTTDTWQVSDADNKDVPVLEVQLKINENPYKAVTRL